MYVVSFVVKTPSEYPRMEFEQLIKRIDWLEKQQRKDQETIAALNQSATDAGRNVESLKQQLKAVDKQVADYASTAARFTQLDAMLAKQRTDMNAAIDDIEKKAQKRERDAMKHHQSELEEINGAMSGFRAEYDMAEIQKRFKDKDAEQIRITQALTDAKARVEEMAATFQGLSKTQKAFDESRRQDLKRSADMQGDLTSLRKRGDETRERTQLNNDTLKNVENRMNEVLATEAERRQAQTAFMDQLSRSEIERERAYKEWRDRFDTFKKQTEALDVQVVAAESAARTAKRANETYNELNQKLERRINEITEMQRLAEERSRQEWVSFKADDQKRWTAFNLTQGENLRELRKNLTSAEARVKAMDEITQTVQDQLHQSTDATEHQMQELMNWAHEWLSASERIMGHGKKPAAKKTAK